MDLQWDLIAAFSGFAFAISITPGPNNFMLMASGAAFGWRRTLPHVAGISLGFVGLLSAVVFGLGRILDEFPQLLTGVKIVGVGWLVWLAWQLATPLLKPIEGEATGDLDQGRARPLKLYEAALFQWVNPKAWTLAAGATGAHAAHGREMEYRLLMMIALFLLIAPACNSAWIIAGNALVRLCGSAGNTRYFHGAMCLLVLSSALIVGLS